MLDFLKKLTFLIFFTGFALWCGLGAYNLIHTVENVGINPVIRVSGYLNNTSSFVLFGFFLPSIPMGLLNIANGIQLPKLTLRLMLFGALIFALIGHYFDTSLRKGIETSNYIECTSKRELTLKHSSRIYVLPPAKCDDLT
ncbi:TPA: hypothetical protein ACPJ0L_003242 [Vibrio alginolyticus]|uniref:hypothetical protein n=1 Tax=Vibrio TaxID=662 RepID=UPI001BD32239|nr:MULTISPECIES: hypothetical protein [Vibrio]EGR1571288.1 hypothetical protein [Vibrio alginolyticus]EJL6750590.1 hypothetical protein [Vibrio alginolyticus]EJL6856508.1 hypothetical protein [Vibrio alginolyticus]EKY4204340.1 hypothetical protein [Vibrio alginolyticus]ELB2837645.1 hypothetical protein [Vibrio alginolyticus]